MGPAGSAPRIGCCVTALVGHLSLAIQHVRQFEIDRETSLTLQRAMLPPTRAAAGFAVRYEPAVRPLEIGGDWYDVLPVGEHRIGIIVGDCVGRGLAAAAVMGQLRSSARALFLTGAAPGRLLEQLDSVAELIPDAYCTTAFVAILDTGPACCSTAAPVTCPPCWPRPMRRPRCWWTRRRCPSPCAAASRARRRRSRCRRIDADAVHRRPRRTQGRRTSTQA